MCYKSESPFKWDYYEVFIHSWSGDICNLLEVARLGQCSLGFGIKMVKTC